MSALPHALQIEKETLRNLAGPELYMQTGLEPLHQAALVEIEGGSVSNVLSAIGSAIVSAVGSAIISGVASAVGSAVGSAVASGPVSAGTSAAASAVSSAGSGASGGLAASAYFSYHLFDEEKAPAGN